MVVAYNDIINAIAKAEDVALYNARARAIELSNGCKPSKEDDDKAIEIESWIQLLTRAAANYDHETCLTDDIIWDIIQNVNEQNRDVDCDVSRTYSRNASSGGGSNVPSGYVERVLGLYVDNTNPSLPVIEIFVDPLTISGDGTQADPFSAIGGGGGATNLGYTASPTDGTVTSSTGTDATLPLADGTNAGLLKPSHFSVLENENQAGGYVGTDANNEMLSDYYIEQINVVTAQALVAGSDLVSLKAYILDDADGGGRIIKVLAAAGVTNQFYQYAIDVTSGEIGTYDITTDVFTPIAGGSQTLAQTLILGNTSGANDIEFDAAQGLLFSNTSRLREGTIDAGLGGTKGIAQICAVGYELKWEAGRLYVMDGNGLFIRQSLYNFTTTPTVTDDTTKGYMVGSLWTLDDGTVYVCSDSTTGAAVWAIGGTPDLQQVTDVNNTTTNNILVDDGANNVVTIFAGGVTVKTGNSGEGNIRATTMTNVVDFELPNKAAGTETFAMLSDITSGSGIPHATAAGTDTYTATVSGVVSYSDGDAYLIRFTNGNTTSATLNISGAGVVPLYRNNDGQLIGGDIWDGGEMLCVYNSTLNIFQCIGTSPNSIFAYITNAESIAITKGQVVYAFGGVGDRMTVKLANNTSDATSARTVGVVLSASIAANQKGIIILQGLLDGLSTLKPSVGSWADGDIVYLSNTAGGITRTKQYAPNHMVYIGTVTTASNGTSGRMYVKIQNGYELDELHNVQAQSPTLKDTLWYDNTVSPAQWKTASISTILGYTPISATSTDTLTNKRITARSGTVASSATPTINTDNVDYYSITALAAAITSFTTNLSGTPTIGQTLWISIKDNGTARAITWGASFESSTIALPTTTVISTRLDVAFIWNELTSVWRCVGTC